MTSRRDFFKYAGIAGGAVAAASVSKVAMAALPEPVIQTSAETSAPLVPNFGRPYNPVVTLNGWTLPWRMNQGVKEFHLVAEPVVREMAPGFSAHLWGYNGQSPGPTIEVVEGDRVGGEGGVDDDLGLGETARRCGARIERLYGENERGRAIMDMRYADLDPRWHGLGMQRGALFEVLRGADAHAADVQTGVQVEHVDAGRGVYTTTDGREHGPFDLIVVANGAHSGLRSVLGDAVRRDALYPWGAIWCLADDPRGRFAHDLEQRYRRAREMCGVLPVGTLPGEAVSARKLSVYWSVPTAELDAVLAAGITPVREAIARLWPDAAALVATMPDLSAWRRASYRDVVLSCPFRERVVLIGDTVHATTPHLASGACIGIEDAIVLAEELGRQADLGAALAAFEERRWERCRMVVLFHMFERFKHQLR